MNLLNAEWQGAGKIGLGGRSLQTPISGQGFAPGENVTLGVRPEHLRVASSDAGGALRASVEFSEYLGGTQYLYCQLADGQPVTVEHRSPAPIGTGAEITLEAAASDLRVFDQRGVRAL